MKDRHLFFLGIGGIGMSALARWFHAHGAEVAGYDRTATPLTEALQREGMPVDTTGSPDALPDSLRADLAARRTDRWTLVHTPAIPDDLPLMAQLRDAGFALRKRAEVLGELTRDQPLLAVAGTHGKTTTSSLLAHILQHAGQPVEAFLGGIPRSSGSNLLLAGGDHPRPWIVAEADEFDRSFLTLYPQHAVITSAEADHLDIYGDAEAFQKAFHAFAEQVHPEGLLLHTDAAAALTASSSLPGGHALYGQLDPSDPWPDRWCAAHSHPDADGSRTHFVLRLKGEDPLDIHWPMPGVHNAANATAAAALAIRAGVPSNAISPALAAFPGIARRFELRHDQPGLTVIDDYAHHPSEITGTVAAARSAYRGRRLVGVFQPHLFSRTRDFMDAFAEALSALDHCILLPIYPARERPIPGVDAQGVGEKMVGCPVETPEESRFLDVLEQCEPDVLLFMGAGDLDRWIPPSIERLSRSKTTHREQPTPQP